MHTSHGDYFIAGDANSVPAGAGGDFCTCNPGYACSTCGTYPCVGDNDTLSEDVWGCNLTLCVSTRLIYDQILFFVAAIIV